MRKSWSREEGLLLTSCSSAMVRGMRWARKSLVLVSQQGCECRERMTHGQSGTVSDGS